MRLRLLLSVTLPIFPSVKKRILQYGGVSMLCLILKNRYYWRSLIHF